MSELPEVNPSLGATQEDIDQLAAMREANAAAMKAERADYLKSLEDKANRSPVTIDEQQPENDSSRAA